MKVTTIPSLQDFLHIDADSHVYQLLLAKLQMGDPRNFDSRLYMCNEAFHYLDVETLGRLTESGLLPLYCFCVLIYGYSMLSCTAKPKNMTENQSTLHSSSSCSNKERTLNEDQKQFKSQDNCIMRKQENIETLNSEKSWEFQNLLHTEENGISGNLSSVLNGEVRRETSLKHCGEEESYGIISDRPDIAFFLGKLDKYSISSFFLILMIDFTRLLNRKTLYDSPYITSLPTKLWQTSLQVSQLWWVSLLCWSCGWKCSGCRWCVFWVELL